MVTDVARCTSLGFDILGQQGSSVDAAIAAALCLGIIHPHTSGIGGYGASFYSAVSVTLYCNYHNNADRLHFFICSLVNIYSVSSCTAEA